MCVCYKESNSVQLKLKKKLLRSTGVTHFSHCNGIRTRSRTRLAGNTPASHDLDLDEWGRPWPFVIPEGCG